MKVLIIGDVIGQGGCDFVREQLPLLRRQYQPDIVIANGENSAQGNGILPYSANHLFDSGVDLITTGNHALKRREIYELFDSDLPLIRPANFHRSAPGVGVYVIDKLKYKLAVVNLMGVALMEPLSNPFDCIDELLTGIDTKNIIVDFHAEATSEKAAMGFYLDGRVSAVVGTHTHVQTADERILPKGTGYITDLGMCGAIDSVLGVRPEQAIQRLKTALPTRFENAEGPHLMGGVVLEIDQNTGKCTNMNRFLLK